MATKHVHSPGVVLELEDGRTAHSAVHFEQEISIDPVTAKPVSSVTSLSVELIVLDPDGTRRITTLLPIADGSVVRTDTTEWAVV